MRDKVRETCQQANRMETSKNKSILNFRLKIGTVFVVNKGLMKFRYHLHSMWEKVATRATAFWRNLGATTEMLSYQSHIRISYNIIIVFGHTSEFISARNLLGYQSFYINRHRYRNLFRSLNGCRSDGVTLFLKLQLLIIHGSELKISVWSQSCLSGHYGIIRFEYVYWNINVSHFQSPCYCCGSSC